MSGPPAALSTTLNAVTVPPSPSADTTTRKICAVPRIEYESLEPHDANHQNFLVLGPWRHGSWASSSRHLGNLDYTEPIGKEFRARSKPNSSPTTSRTSPANPRLRPRRHRQLPNRLQHLEALRPLPAQRSRPPAFISPARPARAGPIPHPRQNQLRQRPRQPRPLSPSPHPAHLRQGSQWYNWITEDQRFVTDRKDLAVFKLPVLKKDLILTGEIIADIFASTTGSDNDLVVKLIDQYPDDDPTPRCAATS